MVDSGRHQLTTEEVAKLNEHANFLECREHQKATAGPSTAPFAKNANGYAQDDRFIARRRKVMQTPHYNNLNQSRDCYPERSKSRFFATCAVEGPAVVLANILLLTPYILSFASPSTNNQ